MSALNANPSRQLVVKLETVTLRYLHMKVEHKKLNKNNYINKETYDGGRMHFHLLLFCSENQMDNTVAFWSQERAVLSICFVIRGSKTGTWIFYLKVAGK